jgi:hypothetical protein
MPQHYDPNQPSVPRGHGDGGQWTHDGRGVETIARHADGQGAEMITRQANLLPVVAAVAAGTAAIQRLRAGLALFSALSAVNTANDHAILELRAREYRRAGQRGLRLVAVAVLTQEQLKEVCKSFDDVQDYANRAAAETPNKEFFRNAGAYGSAVHKRFKDIIDGDRLRRFQSNKPELRTEYSSAEGFFGKARYGEKGSKRTDALEADKSTGCIYELKTLDAIASWPRMHEYAQHMAKNFPHVNRIIVTQVKPMLPR